jgi:cytochrome P450
VFITPQAFSGMDPTRDLWKMSLKRFNAKSVNADIYDTHTLGREHFPKTNFLDLGLGDHGLSWEMDPERHHAKAKKLAPAFSTKALKAKEATMHKYTDAFVQRMKELGSRKEGIELRKVSACQGELRLDGARC